MPGTILYGPHPQRRKQWADCTHTSQICPTSFCFCHTYAVAVLAPCQVRFSIWATSSAQTTIATLIPRSPTSLIRCHAARPSVQLRCVDEKCAQRRVCDCSPQKTSKKPHTPYHSPHPVGLAHDRTHPRYQSYSIPHFFLNVYDFCDVRNDSPPADITGIAYP